MQAKDIRKNQQDPSSSLLDPKLKRLFPKASPKQNGVKEGQSKLVQLFQSGDFEACKSLAHKLAEQYPENSNFWKILGAVQQNLDENEAAITSLLKAKSLNNEDAEVLYNLGNAYFELEQYEEAIGAYQNAVAISPMFAKAYFNLGSVLDKDEQLLEAEVAFRKAIEINPSEIQPYLKLVAVLDKLERIDEAIELLSNVAEVNDDAQELHLALAFELGKNNQTDRAKYEYEKAIRLEPTNIDTYNNYGLYLQRLKEFQNAEAIFLKGLKEADANAEILCSLGMLYYEIERYDQAEHCLKQAIVSFPDSCIAFINFALFLFNMGKVYDAVSYGLKALDIEPDNTAALNNLGLAYHSCSLFDESVEQFKTALKHDPKNTPAMSNLSLPLKRLGLLSEAAEYIKQGLEINPEAHDLLINLASIYQAQGKIIEASEVNKKAIQVAPEKLMAYHNLLFDMCYSNAFSRETIMKQLREYGAMATKVATFEFDRWKPNAVGEKLKIGFVSADFILHPVTSFFQTILEQFDQEKFELYAYSNNAKEDHITQKIKPYFKKWQTIISLTDESAARLIHDDGINLLIDLSGHTGGTRIPMFAYKPAPVQITWLGYWASTGIEQMDYILLDDVSAPPNIQDQFTEKVKYLPVSRFCYSPPENSIPVAPLPALKNGYVTLGCYHNYSKVTDEVIELWCAVMRSQGDLRIRWITAAFKDTAMVESMRQRFHKQGVDAARIDLLPSLPNDKYLESFSDIDMMIDAFPFTSCTTASDGLWMGVPTVAMAGNSVVARQSTSLMCAVGLPDWVAANTEEYINKIAAITSDLTALAEIRASLRSRIQSSPFGNAELFTRNLETALLDVWQTFESTNQQVVTESPMFTHVNSNELAQHVIVTATMKPEAEFWAQTATGLSLKKLQKQGVAFSHHIAFENKKGLPEVYNNVIDHLAEDCHLIFIHDDVWFDQFDLLDAISEGLEVFDMIGVAGNTRRLPRQANWLYVTPNDTDQKAYLSGAVGCGEVPYGLVNEYGEVGQSCETLDGVLFGVKAQALKDHGVRFDTRFMFHFYDMDFCRSARQAGLRLGTWGLKITHQSKGSFDDKWYRAYQAYLAKWEPEVTPHPFRQVDNELAHSVNNVLSIAMNHIQKGQLADAANLFEEVLTIMPDHSEALHQSGLILARQERWSEALERLNKALKFEPENTQYQIDYIDACRLSGDIEGAKTALNLARKHGLADAFYEEIANDLNLTV